MMEAGLKANWIFRGSRLRVNGLARARAIREGDILIANRGTRTTGGLFRGEEKAVAGGEFFILTVKGNDVIPEYLWWFLDLPSTQQHFGSGLRGTYINGLNRSSLEDLSVPIPSIEEIRAKPTATFSSSTQAAALSPTRTATGLQMSSCKKSSIPAAG